MSQEARYDADTPVTSFTRAWIESSKHVTRGMGQFYRSVIEANRTFLPAKNGNRIETTEEADERLPATSDELAYKKENWTVERTIQVPDKLTVGDSVRFTKRLTEADVRTFAEISGDTNRLHLDPEFAERTQFGRPIVHGTLVGGLISAALARLPGLTVYLSQELQFTKPADIGESLTAACEVVEDLGDGRYRLTTVVEAEDGSVVIDGEAVVLIDDQLSEMAADE